MQTEEIIQGTEEWFNLRKGRATGSEIYKLLGARGLGETGKTYAFEKAVEIVFGLPDEDERLETWDMLRGKQLEPLAFQKFAENNFFEVQKCSFIPYGENAGSSPDALTSNNGVLEIKCPRRTKFFRYILHGAKEISSEYMSQIQMEMKSANAEVGYFFNYYLDKGFEMHHEIIVEPDLKIQELIDERINEFVEIRDSYVVELRNNTQFNFL